MLALVLKYQLHCLKVELSGQGILPHLLRYLCDVSLDLGHIVVLLPVVLCYVL